MFPRFVATDQEVLRLWVLFRRFSQQIGLPFLPKTHLLGHMLHRSFTGFLLPFYFVGFCSSFCGGRDGGEKYWVWEGAEPSTIRECRRAEPSAEPPSKLGGGAGCP